MADGGQRVQTYSCKMSKFLSWRLIDNTVTVVNYCSTVYLKVTKRVNLKCFYTPPHTHIHTKGNYVR